MVKDYNNFVMWCTRIKGMLSKQKRTLICYDATIVVGLVCQFFYAIIVSTRREYVYNTYMCVCCHSYFFSYHSLTDTFSVLRGSCQSIYSISLIAPPDMTMIILVANITSRSSVYHNTHVCLLWRYLQERYF